MQASFALARVCLQSPSSCTAGLASHALVWHARCHCNDMTLVALRCKCGSISGNLDLSRPSRVRVTCHCDDCAAYGRHLGSEHATRIVLAAPDQVELLTGIEHLCCLRLTERGLTRWFAGCCMTPLANTSRYAWLPFVGVMSCTLATVDEARLGPEREVNGSQPTPWGLLFRSLSWLLRCLLLRRHRPNAFFEQGELRARPRYISEKPASPR
jgi:hypothetical protein